MLSAAKHLSAARWEILRGACPEGMKMCVKPQSPEEAQTLARIEQLTAVIAAGGGTGWVYLSRGQAHTQVARMNEAVVDLTCALLANPPLPEGARSTAYNLRGIVYRRLGQFAEAIADATSSLELRPDYAPFWADRGWAYTGNAQPERALCDFARSLELYPYFLAYVYRGAVHFGLGNFAAALADYDQVIELYGEQIAFNSYMNRGIIRLVLNQDYRGAAADLDIAVQRLPGAFQPSSRPHAYRGLVRALQGRHAEALADLEAGQAQGSDPMIPLVRGLIFLDQRDQQALRHELVRFVIQESETGRTASQSLSLAARFLDRPVSVIPELMPLLA